MSNLSNDENFNRLGYDVVTANHPLTTKKVEVCIYFKNFLPFKVADIQFFQECINLEAKLLTKHVILYFCMYLLISRKMNMDLLKITLSLISTQFFSETFT